MPTAFFAYPDNSVQVLPVGCEIKTLASRAENATEALEALAEALGAGGAMYTLQALWTQAREGLDVTTIIFSNRKYQILIENRQMTLVYGECQL